MGSRLKLIILAACLLPAACFPVDSSEDISSWLTERLPTSETYLLKNISPNLPGYKKGFVVAAPWVVAGIQDYRYHWVRDAALVMNTVVTRYVATSKLPKSPKANDNQDYFGRIRDYLNFSYQNQMAPQPDVAAKVGLGEVKFNPDGTRFTQWMRPQNDGPALRAITTLRFTSRLIAESKMNLVRHLYNGAAPGSDQIEAPGLIQRDLDYVAAHWQDAGFDPWEEVNGHHFYTKMVQRKSLRDGAQLARLLGDKAGALRYEQAAGLLRTELEKHWLAAGTTTPSGTVSNGQIWDSFNRVSGVDYKTTGLDASVILAVLHAHNEFDNSEDVGFFSPSDDRVLKTALALSQAFESAFPISSVKKDEGGQPLGVPIGRYPKDKYNGLDSSQAGNPWFLTTAAFAELYYRCAESWEHSGVIPVTSLNLEFLSTLSEEKLQAGEQITSSDNRFSRLLGGLRTLGDRYLRRVKFHEGPQGHLTEEFSRTDGSLQGAQDLSWSYASLLTAAEHRP